MEIKVRKYSKSSDEQGVKECIKELKKFEGQFDPDYYVDNDSVDLLLKDLEQDIENIIVAEGEGNIVGFISFNEDVKNDHLIVKEIPVLYISDLVVRKDYRSHGIGKLLMQEVERIAKEKGIQYLKLTVFSKNSLADNFYKKYGFDDYEKIMIKELS